MKKGKKAFARFILVCVCLCIGCLGTQQEAEAKGTQCNLLDAGLELLSTLRSYWAGSSSDPCSNPDFKEYVKGLVYRWAEAWGIPDVTKETVFTTPQGNVITMSVRYWISREVEKLCEELKAAI